MCLNTNKDVTYLFCAGGNRPGKPVADAVATRDSQTASYAGILLRSGALGDLSERTCHGAGSGDGVRGTPRSLQSHTGTVSWLLIFVFESCCLYVRGISVFKQPKRVMTRDDVTSDDLFWVPRISEFYFQKTSPPPPRPRIYVL
jgi:hypothetical protein